MFIFNQIIEKKALRRIFEFFIENYGPSRTQDLLEELKSTGFHAATLGGLSIGFDDFRIPISKEKILKKADEEILMQNSFCIQGQITIFEYGQKFLDIWTTTGEKLKDEVIRNFQKTPLNPLYMMAFSGARGNINQVRQLVGMRGLMSDSAGKVVDFPIRANFREGLSLPEYLISCYGARKGLIDTALRTADSGYLTRRLVDAAHSVLISEFDCGTFEGILIKPSRNGTNLIGRVAAEDIYEKRNILLNSTEASDRTFDLQPLLDSHTKRVLETSKPEATKGSNQSFKTSVDFESLGSGGRKIIQRNEDISPSLARKIFHALTDPESLSFSLPVPNRKGKFRLRSALTCQSMSVEICQLCYGWNLGQGRLVSAGDAVGILAAQSIGEPGTQLTMRTFHTGGIFAQSIEDKIFAPHAGRIEIFLSGRSDRNKALVSSFELRPQASCLFGKKFRSLYGSTGWLTLEPILIGIRPFESEFSTKNSPELRPKESGQSQLSLISVPAHTFITCSPGQKVRANELIARISRLRKAGPKFFGSKIQIRDFSQGISLAKQSSDEKIDMRQSSVRSQVLKPLKSENSKASFDPSKPSIAGRSSGPIRNEPQESKFIQARSSGQLYAPGSFAGSSSQLWVLNTYLGKIPSAFSSRFSSDPLRPLNFGSQSSKIFGLSGDIFFCQGSRLSYFNQNWMGDLNKLSLDSQKRNQSHLSFEILKTEDSKMTRNQSLKSQRSEQSMSSFKIDFEKEPSSPSSLMSENLEILSLDDQHRPSQESEADTEKNSAKLNRSKNSSQSILFFQDQKVSVFNQNLQPQAKLGEAFFILSASETNRRRKNSDPIQRKELQSPSQIIRRRYTREKILHSNRMNSTHLIQTSRPSVFPPFSTNQKKGENFPSDLSLENNKSDRIALVLRKFSGYRASSNTNREEEISQNLRKNSLLFSAPIRRKFVSEKDDIGKIFLPINQSTSVDIVQGLPKIESLFEARGFRRSGLKAQTKLKVDEKKKKIPFLTARGKLSIGSRNASKSNFVRPRKSLLRRKEENFLPTESEELKKKKKLGQNLRSNLESKTLSSGFIFEENRRPRHQSKFEKDKDLSLSDDFGLVGSWKARRVYWKNSRLDDNKTDSAERKESPSLVDLYSSSPSVLLTLQLNLVNEIQKCYLEQGIEISAQHIEIIVRQMTRKVRIRQGLAPHQLRDARALFFPDDIVDRADVQKLGLSDEYYEPIVLGITKVATLTKSFISAASFQESKRILMTRSIQNDVDFFFGLKENLVCGRFIPAGTTAPGFVNEEI